ncbi:anthrone oxygenase family protein [Haladaptatus cibarius]|uniref:anthrone oxygenase family protein n=1 Tax=Haladaptatus cibarius TaxID=453847 RepID=UPI00130EB66A|nr:anthrone oxygenase family protein [Haladaptatus cibarius]
MIRQSVLSGELLGPLIAVSTIFTGLMAGFFFAYSVSVVLALDTLSAATYTTVMQEINEKVLNAVFGVVFFGAVVVPAISMVILVFWGDWTTLSGRLFLVGVVVYVLGTFAVTMRIHIPMNDDIATWSSASPPDEWAEVRARWTRWNHVRTIAAVVSFASYLAALSVR